jgi:hypothetical protein
MENRERDRMSQRSSSTDAGDINRRTSEEKGRQNSGTGTEFGQNIGRSEDLGEGGDMENRNKGGMGNMENEESRRPSGDKGFGSSSGRSSGSKDIDSIERGDLNENQGSRSNREDDSVERSRH